MEKEISLEELSFENVTALSEEDAFNLLMKVIFDAPKEKRQNYENIIGSIFEFRSISAKNRNLKGDLSMYGFKFFSIPANNKLIMGLRRRIK